MNAALEIASALDAIWRHLRRSSFTARPRCCSTRVFPDIWLAAGQTTSTSSSLRAARCRSTPIARSGRRFEATNRELQPRGLFVSHIFPEHQVVLSPQWFGRLESIERPWKNLSVLRPDMLDLILSKMGRGDVSDLADVRAMLALERAVAGRVITAGELATAAGTAHVPEAYREIFPQVRDRILAEAADVNSRFR